MAYVTIENILMFENLTASEQEQAEELIKIAEAKLRTQVKKHGKNLDEMITQDEDLLLVTKAIVTSAVLRALDNLKDNQPAIAQGSQSALGYTATYTYLNAGQNLYFLKNELKELGLFKQKFGALEVYDNATDD